MNVAELLGLPETPTPDAPPTRQPALLDPEPEVIVAIEPEPEPEPLLPHVTTFDEARAAYAGESMIALDLETGGLSAWRDPLHVIALYGPQSGVATVLHYPEGVEVPDAVFEWLSGFETIVTHNGVGFDFHFLDQKGMGDRVFRPAWYDTMIGEMAVLQTDRRDVRVSLGDTANRRLGKKLDKKIDHAGWALPELSPDHLRYVLGDIGHLIDLRQSQYDRAAETDAIHRDRPKTTDCIAFELELARPMYRMKRNGMPIDLARTNAYLDAQVEKLADAEATLRRHLGDINFNSQPQMMAALARAVDNRDLPENKNYAMLTFPNTTADTLAERAKLPNKVGEIAQALLDFRYIAKRRSMYGETFQKENVIRHGDHDRVHGTIWQNGTSTGRMSSSNPNMQQIPRDMRHCFGGRPGHVIGKTDYSAIEVRVAAVLAEDERMIDAFKAGRDIHTVVGAAGFGKEEVDITKAERQIAKAMSFTLLFGGSVETFRSYAAHNGSHIDQKQAAAAFDRFMAQFPGIAAFRDKADEIAVTFASGNPPYTIFYPSGLKRVLVGPQLRPTTILNNMVQGLAGCGLKKALLLMAETPGVAEHLVAVVHDEVVYEATPDELPELRAEIERCMIAGMHWALGGWKGQPPGIPIAVESTYGETWAGDAANVHTAEK